MSGTKEAENRPASSARILVVEDQDSLRELMQKVLAEAGHQVTVANNGAEAIAAARDAGFDLILMDVNMPVMDGLMATQKIRALNDWHSKVPIISISGDTQSPETAGMDDYICKPFRKAELLLKVDAWLKGESAPPPASSPDEPEGAAFEEACELMGRPWAVRGLTKLKVQIDEAFGADPGVARNEGRLVSQAHALVSLAAILGFSTLSQLCSALEEACRDGHDVQLPFACAKAAASDARRSAIKLIADLRIRDSS